MMGAVLAAFMFCVSVAAQEPESAPAEAPVPEAEAGDAADDHADSHDSDSHDHDADSHDDDSHGEAGSEEEAAADVTKMSPLAFDPDLAIVTAIIFLLLLLFLGKFAWGPITKALDERESSVADQLLQAQKAAEKADATLKEYQQKLTSAMEEARAISAQAKSDAEATREKLLAEAQEAATRERERAVEDIRLAKENALQELAQKSVDQAVELAGGIIRRELKPDDHSQLIRDALAQFPSKN